MARRDLLHKSDKHLFLQWLKENNIDHRPGMGHYEMVQIRAGHRYIPIHDRSKGDHFTVQGPLYRVVRRFLNDKEKAVAEYEEKKQALFREKSKAKAEAVDRVTAAELLNQAEEKARSILAEAKAKAAAMLEEAEASVEKGGQ